MIPIYKAMAVEESAIMTGSTKPSIMTVSDKSTGVIKGKYVVKVFNNLETGKTAKEFYGNLLAREFEFNIPPCALIYVGKEIIAILQKNPVHKRSNLMAGYYYGSKLQEGNIENYTKTIQNSMELWEIENVFGFDTLIFNIDRRQEKPNLFFVRDEVFLIDHELAFNAQYFEKSFSALVADGKTYRKILDYKSGKFARKHLFLDSLRAKNMVETVNFDTFAEYLRSMNPNCLDDLEPLFRKAGIDAADISAIRTYLQEVKNNPTLLVNLLKSFL